MNKTGRIISFFIIVLVTVAMGYISLVGIGEDRKGSLYDIKQGLDLAGGVSITYEVVGEEEPTAEEMMLLKCEDIDS
jgi:SecD/SecF fusion protein